MGKHRKPSGKGTGSVPKADLDILPAFDEKALSALTEKIEKGFGKSKAVQQSADPTSGNHGKGNSSKGRRDSDSKAKPTKPEPNRGTKRDARGNVKITGKRKTESSSRDQKPKNGSGKVDTELLLKEILALGGTEEDLDLVAGAASDDEDVGENYASAQDKSFKKDLAKFVAGLGIDDATAEDASEPEAEMEEEAAKEWEEASDLEESDESEEAPKKPITAVPEVKKSDTSSKGPNRLVSVPPI